MYREVFPLYEAELQILKTAIINEMEGEHFYRLAAANNGDEQARQAFLYLAAEEGKHQRWLREMAGKLAAGNPLAFNAGSLDETPHQNIFDRFRPGTETGSLAVSAMHVGLLLEKASVDYYREAASLTSLAVTRQLYEKLTNWELAHLEYFEKAYDDLKKEWWQRQGFSPS
jgi:rubrerythrin